MAVIACIAAPPGARPVVSSSTFAWACVGTTEPRTLLEVQGETFGGSFPAAMDWMTGRAESTCAWIVLLTGGHGAEAFLSGLPASVVSRPVVGGASCRTGDKPGWTHPAASDVAVLSIQEGAWAAHPEILHLPAAAGSLRCGGTHPRAFSEVVTERGSEPASAALQRLREACGLRAGDWDGLALQTEAGNLLHLHPAGDGAACGCNLPASRTVAPAIFREEAARARLVQVADRRAIAFGCAGLHGMFRDERPWEAIMPTTYLYGEIAMFGARPLFTNLTVSILRRLS